jgi:hypothetical protein
MRVGLAVVGGFVIGFMLEGLAVVGGCVIGNWAQYYRAKSHRW